MLARRVIIFGLIGSASFAATSQQQAHPAAGPCISEAHHQFDFWVGYWDVYKTGSDRLYAHSLIEKLYDGCTIRENWMPLANSGGGSLSSFDPDSRTWRQVWVDKDNSWGVFEGGMKDGAMVLSGSWSRINGPGTSAITRTYWRANPDGTVRQRGEVRDADGVTWRPDPTFDFTYKRAMRTKN